MKVYKQVLDFYINSSIHVALAIVALAGVTFLEFEMPIDASLLLFIFFASITGYNFVKYFGVAKFHHRKLASWLKVIQVFSMVCFLLMCNFALHLKAEILFYIAGFGLVTFLYAIPFLPKHLFMDHQKNLRNIGGLKVYVIATVCAGVTVLLPLLNYGQTLNMEVWLSVLQRFIVVIILMLPFEIRDLKYDNLKLSTIPQKIGIVKTKMIGIFLSLLYFLLEFFKNGINRHGLSISLLFTILMIMILIVSKKNQTKYFSSFWVESVPVIWMLLHLVL